MNTRLASSGGGSDAKSERRYWRSLDERAEAYGFDELVNREFPVGASEWMASFSRRHFLKLMGASVALAGAAGCTRQPTERIVPYVKQPEDLTLGKPLYFATAMTLGGFATGLIVESHEGHPTKIEGNPEHPMSLGATNVFHQASLLDLYDPDRSQAVLREGEVSSWTAFLAAFHDALELHQAKRGEGLRILTETVTSPTLGAQIQAVLAKFPEARWHQYEPVNRDNIREGARIAFGEIVDPQYRFEQARVVLSLDSDFMFRHPASLRYARKFADGRRFDIRRREINRLYAVESTPSVTGSNADHRLPLRCCEIVVFTRMLAERLGIRTGGTQDALSEGAAQWLDVVARDLQRTRRENIVIAGEGLPPSVHALVHAINASLNNIGSTIVYTATAEFAPTSQVESLRELASDLEQERVQSLVILGGNPAFSSPADLEFSKRLQTAEFCVHLSSEVNETSALCQWHVPQNHFLESWSDARAYGGTISVVQPLILPLYAGRSSHEVLDAMLQPQPRGDYEIIRDYWKSQRQWPNFEEAWRKALHDGLIANTAFAPKKISLRALPEIVEPEQEPTRDESYEVTFRPDPAIWDGRFANNGWLQELPKPISKLTWDNAAFVSPATASRHVLANGDVVELTLENHKLRVPIWITPGQADHSIALTLGYGRRRVGRVGKGTGFDVYQVQSFAAPWFASGGRLTKTSERYRFASTQTQQVIDSEERGVFRESTLAEFLKNSNVIQQSVESPSEHQTLFNPQEHAYDGYRWGMVIDLTTCIGCNACMLACQSENNIPVVGKDQVARHRAMHWIRVDAYFSGDSHRPAISHQPVPCMHCENAPCELVCPVAATLHDKEGLNLQVYNRCIGTRYCSNNCPYKVRRFNFFQYADYHTPSLKPMRNPNVTVRSRGVMEKCTYCIQRISAARIAAKIEGRAIRDGELQTACQQACPASAIVFGDVGDTQSRVAKLKQSLLNFSMLGELNTRPRTTYLAKLRNPNPELIA